MPNGFIRQVGMKMEQDVYPVATTLTLVLG